MQEDRRKYPRFKLSVEVRYQSISGNYSASQSSSKTRNVSAGGVCLVVNGSVKVGDVLELSIKLADGELRIKGKVLWIDENVKLRLNDTEMGFEAGIQFLDLDDQARKDINQAIFNTFHQ